MRAATSGWSSTTRMQARRASVMHIRSSAIGKVAQDNDSKREAILEPLKNQVLAAIFPGLIPENVHTHGLLRAPDWQLSLSA